jgi:hypothetical protein
VARARRRCIREQGLLDSTHVIYKTSLITNLTRAYGRGLTSERVMGRVRRGIAVRGHDRPNVDHVHVVPLRQGTSLEPAAGQGSMTNERLHHIRTE